MKTNTAVGAVQTEVTCRSFIPSFLHPVGLAGLFHKIVPAACSQTHKNYLVMSTTAKAVDVSHPLASRCTVRWVSSRFNQSCFLIIIGECEKWIFSVLANVWDSLTEACELVCILLTDSYLELSNNIYNFVQLMAHRKLNKMQGPHMKSTSVPRSFYWTWFTLAL